MKEFFVSLWNIIDYYTVFHTGLLDDFTFPDLFLSFFIFSFVGWIVESFYCSVGEKKLINRGFLYGPMCPIYGTGCIVMHLTLTRLFDYPWAVILAGMVICDIVEYITSFAMEKLFNARWWDYTGYFLNINGRICLKHTIFWGIGAYAYIYIVQPFHLIWYTAVPVLYRRIALYVILGIFLVDLLFTVKAAMNIRKIFNRINRIRNTIIELADKVQLGAEEVSDDIRQTVREHAGEIIVKTAELTRDVDEATIKLEDTFRKHGLSRKSTNEKKYSSYGKLSNYGNKILFEIRQKADEIAEVFASDREMY